jgi:F0F1-type ATP synthase assembly protein I
MPGQDHDSEPGLGKSLESLQESAQQAAPAATASYSLIGAIILFTGIGYGVDVWKGTAPWGLVIGLMLGLVTGFYQLARAVWRR